MGLEYEPITLISLMKDAVSETDAFLNFFFMHIQRRLLMVDQGDIGQILAHLDCISALENTENVFGMMVARAH